MKYPAWYAGIIGVLLVGLWPVLIASGSVPELEGQPWAIGFHIAAEMGTAIALLSGAWAVLKTKAFGRIWLLVGLGMLIYSAVNNLGYYLQSGQRGLVLLFAAILASALWAVWDLKEKQLPIRRHGR